MHEACYDCVKKHVSQAMVIHEEEVGLGYPEHIYRVIGHLAEASRECFEAFPEMAELLRKYRLMVMEDPTTYPDYTEFLIYLDAVIAAEDAEVPVPKIPPEIEPEEPA